MNFRPALVSDCPLLAELNHQLIRDEGHRNAMTVPELEQRMKSWLAGEYRAVIFEEAGEVAGYALFREEPEEIYLRQLFIVRHRRRQGRGRQAMGILFQIWPKSKRLRVDVLVANQDALKFWRAVGLADYCMTLEKLPSQKAGDGGIL